MPHWAFACIDVPVSHGTCLGENGSAADMTDVLAMIDRSLRRFSIASPRCPGLGMQEPGSLARVPCEPHRACPSSRCRTRPSDQAHRIVSR